MIFLNEDWVKLDKPKTRGYVDSVPGHNLLRAGAFPVEYYTRMIGEGIPEYLAIYRLPGGTDSKESDVVFGKGGHEETAVSKLEIALSHRFIGLVARAKPKSSSPLDEREKKQLAHLSERFLAMPDEE